MQDDDLGIDGIFPEPERPPSPEPTVEIYERDKANIPRPSGSSSQDWDSVSIRLVGTHPLWGHHLWNAARSFASFLDEHATSLVVGKNVLELGAGGALPGIVTALDGARKVVLTDYPDPDLVNNISHNVHANIQDGATRNRVSVQGYIWGRDVTPLLDAIQGDLANPQAERFDLLILSDLVFNHAAHDALLDTCAETLRITTSSDAPDAEIPVQAAENSSQSQFSTPAVLVFYTHHRPHLAHRDLEFFSKARSRGWICEEFYTQRTKPMFPEDPGDLDVRSTVHGWRLYPGPSGIHPPPRDSPEPESPSVVVEHLPDPNPSGRVLVSDPVDGSTVAPAAGRLTHDALEKHDQEDGLGGVSGEGAREGGDDSVVAVDASLDSTTTAGTAH